MYSIIGAGIGGLMAALVFEKLNIPYQLFEKSSGPNAIGAGIWLAPNALTILEFVGILKDVQQAGNVVDRITLGDAQLNPLADVSQLPAKDKYGFSTVAIHRGQLQQCLINAIPKTKIHWNKALQSITQLKTSTEIQFSDATKFKTDYIIGADGINSKVRTLLFPKSKIRYSGQTCWRGVSNYILPESFKNRGVELWGKGIRFGFSQLNHTQTSWFAVKKANAFGKDDKLHLKADLKELYQDFTPFVHQLIENTSLEYILRNDITDLKPINKWYHNNVCLIGDAAHATTPNMGQGGAQAIEDAYYLGLLISKKPKKNVFSDFQEVRNKRVNHIVNQSWYTGKVAHFKTLSSIRNFIFKHLPKSMIDKNMYSVYDLKEL